MVKSCTLLLGSIIFLAFAPVGTHAQNTELQWSLCSKIDAAFARLACYDAITGRSTEPPATDSTGTDSEWQITDDLSPIDRSRRVILARFMDSSTPSRSGGLGLRCIENRTSIVVVTDQFISDYQGNPSVEWRIGDMDPVRDRWSVGGDTNGILFGPTGSSAISMIHQMTESRDFAFRYVDNRGDSQTYVFDLTGLNEHVGLLADACAWP